MHIALTVIGPRDQAEGRDVVVRAGGHRLVSELADDLAAYLGLPDASPAHYGVVVQRTGEHLVPERPVEQVDLREGDVIELLSPGETVAGREPRRPLRRLGEP